MGDNKFYISDYFQNLSVILQPFSNQEIEASLLQYVINVKRIKEKLVDDNLKKRLR